MINAVIIDDEQHCREALKQSLSGLGNPVNIIAEFSSALDAGDQLIELSPHLLFLDVEMPGKTGLEFLAGIKEVPFEVIFTTAHEKYALQAIKASAIDYLLKPVSKQDLQKAVDKLERKQCLHPVTRQVDVLIQHYFNRADPDKTIAVPTLNGLEFIRLNDIIRLKAEVNYTRIFFKDNAQLLVSRTMKEFEELLTPFSFFRIHSGHMINLRLIRRYTKGAGGLVTLQDGTELEVSRNRKEEFLSAISALKL